MTLNPRAMSATTLLVALGIIYLVALFAYSQGFNRGQLHPPCEEDQAYIVALDTDPTHGLTWRCEALDVLAGRGAIETR